MKKLCLLLILFLPIITGCVTTKKAEIVLPSKPERTEMPKVETVSDLAKVINYYNALVLEWEEWGKKVEEVTGVKHE